MLQKAGACCILQTLTCFCFIQITAEDVSSEKARSELFQALLEDSKQTEQFNALINLLRVWPALQNSKYVCRFILGKL